MEHLGIGTTSLVSAALIASAILARWHAVPRRRLAGPAQALKILLSPEDLISTSTSRDDVVALVNILWKMSDSLEARDGYTEGGLECDEEYRLMEWRVL